MAIGMVWRAPNFTCAFFLRFDGFCDFFLAMRLRSPLVLIPDIPYGWSSFWQVLPAYTQALESLGALPLRLNPFAHVSTKDLGQALEASYWVIPYRALSSGGVDLAKNLTHGLGRRPPLVVVSNGEGARGGIFLQRNSRFFSTADIFLTACRAEARLLKKAFPKLNFVFHRGIPVAQPKPFSKATLSKWRSSHGFRSGDKILLYAGRLSRQKNILALLESFSHVRVREPRSQLVLLGAPDLLGEPHLPSRPEEAYGLQLAREVARLGLSGAVHFMGSVGQEELALWLASCDLHLSLTTHFGEDFGYSIAQGMAHGAPTLVTKWGGGLDFIEGGGAAGIPVSIDRKGKPTVSPLRAARAIEAALEAPPHRLGRRGRHFYRANLSFSSFGNFWRSQVEPAVRESLQQRGEPLRPDPMQRRLLLSLQRRLDLGGGAHLFSSPRDSLYQLICRSYLGSRTL